MELDHQTKVIALLSGYVRELKEGKDYLEATYKTAENITKLFASDTDDMEEMKSMTHEGLPNDCIEEWGEVKFCHHRQGHGNKCKQCSNYI